MKSFFYCFLFVFFLFRRHLQNLKISTIAALKKQLELAEKNRSLWQKSNSEVNKLKSMLALAEQNEQQLRTQFNNSQQHAQRLKTKIQTIERQVTSLNLGLVTHRYIVFCYSSHLSGGSF